MEYKSNSHKTRTLQAKKLEKVVSGKVRTKKKTEFQKLSETFFSAEDFENAKSYIFLDVLIPTLKKTILDIVNVVLYGDGYETKRGTTASKISYRKYYDEASEGFNYRTTRARNNYNFNDIIFDNRGEAEDVLLRMDELLMYYEMVSVADLYELTGIQGRYTDNDYGWTNLRDACVVRTRDGYLLKMPKIQPLK